MKKLWKNSNFVLSVFGRFVSRLGTYFQNFALSLFVLNTTGDPKLFASVLVVAMIPQLIIGPFAGVLVDRFDRKKIIVGLDFCSGIVIATFIGVYLVNGTFSMLHIYTIEILLSLINVFFAPAIGTVIPNIVEKEDLATANSINSLFDSVTNVASALIAGFMYGIFGIVPIMIINSVSFILSAISEMFIEIPKLNIAKEKLDIRGFFTDFKEGITFSVKNKNVLAFCFTALVANFALAPFFSVVLPFIAKGKMGISDSLFGIFMAVMMSGMIIAPMIAPTFIKKWGYKKVTTYGFAFSGMVIFSGAAVFLPRVYEGYSQVYTPLGILAIGGLITILAIVILNIAISVSFQQIVPNEYFGRVGAVANTIGTGAVPVGQIFFGILLGSLSTSMIFIIVGVCLFMSSATYSALSKDGENASKAVVGEA